MFSQHRTFRFNYDTSLKGSEIILFGRVEDYEIEEEIATYQGPITGIVFDGIIDIENEVANVIKFFNQSIHHIKRISFEDSNTASICTSSLYISSWNLSTC